MKLSNYTRGLKLSQALGILNGRDIASGKNDRAVRVFSMQ